MARQFFLTLFLAALCVGGARAACVQAHTFVTGEVLTAAVLNANPGAEVTCINNITNANIGAAGIYASQIIPTNTTQATFGGSIAYVFPAGLTVNGGTVAPVYTQTGTAVTKHCVLDSVTTIVHAGSGRGTWTFSGAAVFANSTYFASIYDTTTRSVVSAASGAQSTTSYFIDVTNAGDVLQGLFCGA